MLPHKRAPGKAETMASNPTQERQEAFLHALHKGQETVNRAFSTWAETVRSAPSPPPVAYAQQPQRPFTVPDPQDVLISAYNFAEDLYAGQRQFAGELPDAEEGTAAAPAREPARSPWTVDEAQVYTMRDLNQRTAEVMREIEERGASAFITRHGRFVAMITPLVAGQVESRVLAEMARQINKGPGQ